MVFLWKDIPRVESVYLPLRSVLAWCWIIPGPAGESGEEKITISRD